MEGKHLDSVQVDLAAKYEIDWIELDEEVQVALEHMRTCEECKEKVRKKAQELKQAADARWQAREQ